MRSDKVFKGVVNQHECAMRIFKDMYSFKVKQDDILFYLRYTLSKHQSEQLADQNKVEALNKKIDKRQITIDKLTSELEIARSVTDLDINYDRE